MHLCMKLKFSLFKLMLDYGFTCYYIVYGSVLLLLQISVTAALVVDSNINYKSDFLKKKPNY